MFETKKKMMICLLAVMLIVLGSVSVSACYKPPKCVCPVPEQTIINSYSSSSGGSLTSDAFWYDFFGPTNRVTSEGALAYQQYVYPVVFLEELFVPRAEFEALKAEVAELKGE